MNVLGIILATALGGAPASPASPVSIDVRDASQRIGISVSVKGWARNQVSVEQAESDKDVRAKITRDGSGVHVTAVYTGPERSSFFGLFRWGSHRQVSWTVYVPSRDALDVLATNSTIEVRDVTGALSASTSNGNIRIASAGPAVRAHTSNGWIDASLATLGNQSPHIDLATSNGHVALHVPRGFSAHVSAATSNGHVHNPFDNANGPGSATIRSSNGSIDVSVGS